MAKFSNAVITLLVLVVVMLFISYFDFGSEKKLPELNQKEEVFGGGVSGIGGNADREARAIDYDEEFKKWTKAIREQGPSVAYEEFKQAFAYDYFGTQHSAAHIFGEILFDEEGLEGLAVCDSTFAFGCFHSFFGKALYVLGESVISDMDQVCLQKYGEFGTGCQHGIGHGLLQYAGYNNLTEALELCKYTTQKVAIFGCTSGVFMEYNVPLLTYKDGSFGTRPRELNKNNPYEPCDTLPNKFQESCYYEMPQWWDKVFFGDFKEIGELCDKVSNQEFKHSCFLGIGNVVAPGSGYNVEKTKGLCGMMPNSGGELSCRSGSSWSFFANPDYRHLAPEMCADLDEETKKECAKESDLITEGLNK